MQVKNHQFSSACFLGGSLTRKLFVSGFGLAAHKNSVGNVWQFTTHDLTPKGVPDEAVLGPDPTKPKGGVARVKSGNGSAVVPVKRLRGAIPRWTE